MIKRGSEFLQLRDYETMTIFHGGGVAHFVLVAILFLRSHPLLILVLHDFVFCTAFLLFEAVLGVFCGC